MIEQGRIAGSRYAAGERAMHDVPTSDFTLAAEVRQEAWRLLDAARDSGDPHRRRLLLFRAFEQAQRAEELENRG
jgi:hypothetical protein